MRSERLAPRKVEPDRSVQRASHVFPRVVRFPRCRDGELDSGAEHFPRPLADGQGDGALPQAACAWAQSIWLPRVMRAPWMAWAQAVRDTFIGQIP